MNVNSPLLTCNYGCSLLYRAYAHDYKLVL